MGDENKNLELISEVTLMPNIFLISNFLIVNAAAPTLFP
jgi:hypothetical protein